MHAHLYSGERRPQGGGRSGPLVGLLRRGWPLLALLALLTWRVGHAQPMAATEYALKSALLFKLPHFVYRTDIDRHAPLHLCLLGSNPFGGALDKLAQTPIDGRAVRLRRLETAKEAIDCEFIFISRSETSQLDAVLKRIGSYPVVTVSDIDGFARAGGMVEFSLGAEGSAISILINRQPGQKLGIEFNAQLLRLAKVVEP